jgi:hypothetical protein
VTDPGWTAAEHEREKRRFIESRLRWRQVWFHASLIFCATCLAGWLVSWLLLLAGWTRMSSRYAVSFAISYLVFLAAVRVWADFMRQEREAAGGAGAIDWLGGNGEGCLWILAVWGVAAVLAAVFMMAGGLPLLLEAAFEVVFAGVVVHRAARRQVLGEWLRVLVRNTWLPALVTLLVLVSLAGALQSRVPEARTFADAVRAITKK